jgi:hypothetical protein
MILAWRGLRVDQRHIIEYLSYVEVASSLGALALMRYRRQIRQYLSLSLFLAVRVLSLAICMPLMKMAGHQLSAATAYDIYFPVYWTCYAGEAILGFFIIYGMYNMAMAPLKGLHRLGMLMFRWAGGIAIAIAVTMAFGPHVTSIKFIIRVVTQLQQTQSILTLCMLLFVCMAIRPMGLSYGSKIFGISLGLGLLATSDLVSSAWFPHFHHMFSSLAIINEFSIVLALSIWSAYFAMPEPRRRMIVLPTTSPFLRWNQISMALGDEPGFVALGDFTPDMFAPAEVEVMRRASLKMSRAAAS